MVGAPTAPQPGRVYEYQPLRELARKGQEGRRVRANFYAVCYECTEPRRTKGTDWVCNVRVWDPSLGEYGEPLEMVCFAPERHELPRLKEAGDIIRMHRVQVQRWKNKPQIMAKLEKNRQGNTFGAAYVLFSRGGRDFDPYQCPSATFTFSELDKGVITSLRAAHLGQGGTKSEYVKRLAEMEGSVESQPIDVAAKVVGVQQLPGCLAVFLWDGSDAQPVTYSAEKRDVKGFLDQQWDSGMAEEHYVPLALPLEGGRDLPLVGSAVPLVMPLPSEGSSTPAEAPKAGQWVMFRMVRSCWIFGQLQLFFTGNSKWAVCLEDEKAEQLYEVRMAENTVSEWAPRASQALPTLNLHPSKKFTSIREMQLDALQGKPGKYRALVRVLQVEPGGGEGGAVVDAAAFVADAYQAAVKKSARIKGKDPVFFVHFTLEDATGSVQATLSDELPEGAATKFFGCSAKELKEDPAEASRVGSGLSGLVGAGAEGKGVWMDCCLVQYFVASPHTPATCRYAMFGARLKDAAPGAGAAPREPAPAPPPRAQVEVDNPFTFL